MKYLPQLDGLRALAILMVFAHHVFRVPLLWAGVDLFFILSGYLITSILLRDSETMSFLAMLRRFYVRRAERIVPAYVMFIVLVVLLFSTDWRHLWIYYAMFLQNIPFANGQINSGPLVPLWSLGVEQQFYLVWPALIYVLPRRWLAPCMAVLLFAVPVLRGVCTHFFADSKPIYVLTPFRIDAMAAGALAALLLPHCDAKKMVRWAQTSMLLGCVAYGLLSMHPWFRRTENTVAFNSLSYSLNIAVLGGLFVWVVLSRDTVLTRLFSSSVLRGLGRISYTFYLVHLAVLSKAQQYLGPLHLRGGEGIVAVVVFAVSTAIATVSWFALEKPILSLSAGHRRTAPRTSAVG